MSQSLEPGHRERAELADTVLAVLQDWFDRADTMPASGNDLDQALTDRLLTPPTDDGRALDAILADLEAAGRSGVYHPSGGHLSYIPNAGLYSAALAEFLAAGLNRYTGVSHAAPGMSLIEHGMVRWMTSLFELGESASGVILSGGSMANFTGLVASRTARLGDEFGNGVIYVTSHTHHSVEKAARLAGFRKDQVRTVRVDADLKMEPSALRAAIGEDRDAGLDPFLVVGSAGSTDTGTVDPLATLAEIVADEGLWLHVDAAYGGFFQLTERGRAAIDGIDRADSIAIDPHKGLSIPFGVGALLVRDEGHLIDANQGRGAYLLEDEHYSGIRDIASLGPELSRPFRALQMWLPLHLHGIAPFREALDSSLDLAAHAYRRLSGIEGLETPWNPDLSIVAFRFADDEVGRRALEAVNRDRVVHLSPTTIDDWFVLRFAILNRRTTQDHIDHAIDIIEKTLIG
ncbi:MAG TPA: aminotransferase class V-fold PLP-dependent enzyme [Acidimicrobiia bacterium]|nr:aminotransferase class V-fold PLP-dependent enzyme [Acidimicrobiia bacterium]